MAHHLSRTATLLALFVCAAAAPNTHAQIVSNVTGQIDLSHEPFFNNGWIWSEELNELVFQPLETQYQYTPVGLTSISASFDGDGYESAGGISQIDYNYNPYAPGAAIFDLYTFTANDENEESGTITASITFDFTTSVPIRYRFEADVINTPRLLSVALNGKEARAWYDYGEFEGNFPLIYIIEEGYDPIPTGWDTYIDEGVLPAGTYQVNVSSRAWMYRNYPADTEGTASLHIQLLGDTDLDGTVGMHDLETVLNNWNKPDPNGLMSADLNGDGFVGIDDLNQVLTAWNADVRPTTASVVNTPEPATAGLMTIVALSLLRRRMSERPLSPRLCRGIVSATGIPRHVKS